MTMSQPSPRAETPAIRIVAGGIAALVALFIAGALVVIPQIGSDLGERVITEVAPAGVIEVEFHGQDGVLRCSAPLLDPEGTLATARAVWGVHAVSLADSCVGGGPATVPATTMPATTAPATTAPASTAVPEPTVLSATLFDGTLVLSGPVASSQQRALLVRVAGESVTPANVVDELEVETSGATTDEVVNRLVLVMKALSPNLVSGSVSWDGASLAADGVYATETLRLAFEEVANLTGTGVTVSARPTATAATAAALEADLNALVGEQPIPFEKGSTSVNEASQPILHQLAGIAERLDGVRIEVQGHTDSEGAAAGNLTLSQERAQAVLDALVALGVPADDLVASGFGEEQLLTDSDGAEDPEASRRVVFEVTTI